MAICIPVVVEKEWKQRHRSQVHDLISDADDEGIDNQPTDGAYVYNGVMIIRDMKYSLIHKNDIPNIVDSLIGDGWSPQGNIQLSPLIQGSDYFTASIRVAKPQGL